MSKSDYSGWLAIVYKGLDAFGDCTEEEHAKILECYEAKLVERFPGIDIEETIDPSRAGIYGPEGRDDWMSAQTDEAFQDALKEACT